jgi:hypothetical protein
MMQRASLAALLACLSACKNMPDIQPGTCGNKVIEGTEDCDVFGTEELSCRPPGTDAECHWDCRPRSDGSMPVCPTGWGCDAQGVCRKASGDYRREGPFDVGDVDWLASVDFDGDGRADLMSSESLNAYQQARFRLHYLEDGELGETRLFPKQTTRPKIARLDGDASDDLLFSNLRIGVLPGRRDRAWVPSTFSTYRLQDGPIRMVSVHDTLVSNGTALAVLTTIGSERGVFLPGIAKDDSLELMVPISESLDDLAGEPISVDLIAGIDSPCRELLFAFRGDSLVRFYDLCKPEEAEPVWRKKPLEHRIELPEGAHIDAMPIVADVNGDGRLDVVIGAEQAAFIAWGGDAGIATNAERVDLLDGIDEKDRPPGSAMPIAIGDVTADDFADFVFPVAVITTRKGLLQGSRLFNISQTNQNAPWTKARIADLNGDGRPDIVAASDAGPSIAFFGGTGTPYLVPSQIEARSSVPFLAVDDFDGDQIGDIAFVERNQARVGPDALRVAFGQLGGTPLPPVQVAQVANAEQLSAFHDGGIGNLMLASSEGVGETRRGLLTLLVGSPDRLPFAPFDLVSFAQDGALTNYAALEIAQGAFSAPKVSDVVALATPYLAEGIEASFWLVPGIDQGKGAPLRLEGELPAGLSAARGMPPGVQVTVASASADLDGDGSDEVAWLMPADADTHCGLFTFDVDSQRDKPRIANATTLVFDRPCTSRTLVARDFDGEKGLDLLVLLGSTDTGTELRVLWNDGAGHFDQNEATTLASPEGELRAVAMFAGERPSLALVTDSGLWRVDRLAASRRAFEAPRFIAKLDDARAVAVLDLDGDGLEDVAAGDANGLWFWKAQLLP